MFIHNYCEPKVSGAVSGGGLCSNDADYPAMSFAATGTWEIKSQESYPFLLQRDSIYTHSP